MLRCLLNALPTSGGTQPLPHSCDFDGVRQDVEEVRHAIARKTVDLNALPVPDDLEQLAVETIDAINLLGLAGVAEFGKYGDQRRSDNIRSGMSAGELAFGTSSP